MGPRRSWFSRFIKMNKRLLVRSWARFFRPAPQPTACQPDPLLLVLGTLLTQGLTSRPSPVPRRKVASDDRVSREVNAARERALLAGLVSFPSDDSPETAAARKEFTAYLSSPGNGGASPITYSAHRELHCAALQAARRTVLAMRDNHEIGGDAFLRLEVELDRAESALGCA